MFGRAFTSMALLARIAAVPASSRAVSAALLVAHAGRGEVVELRDAGRAAGADEREQRDAQRRERR